MCASSLRDGQPHAMRAPSLLFARDEIRDSLGGRVDVGLSGLLRRVDVLQVLISLRWPNRESYVQGRVAVIHEYDEKRVEIGASASAKATYVLMERKNLLAWPHRRLGWRGP